MPNPAFEGVARQIRASLVKAGGEALAQAVYDTKVAAGMTVLTRIHHRQTPLLLMQGLGQAGVTWRSEAIFQESQGHPIAHVDIPAEHNVRAIYSAAMVPAAAHPRRREGLAVLHSLRRRIRRPGAVWVPALLRLIQKNSSLSGPPTPQSSPQPQGSYGLQETPR